MSARNALLSLATALAGFVVVTVVVTELASPAIAFSLFVGLPAGLVGGVLVGGLSYRWLEESDPAARRRGGALAAFGVVFLAALVSLVTVGGLRNSQALPVAGGVGVVGSVAAYLWHRRSRS